jgi:hypothetical protein
MTANSPLSIPERIGGQSTRPTSEAGASLCELVDTLTDALVEARLALDALADSLRASAGGSSLRGPLVNLPTGVGRIGHTRCAANSRRTVAPTSVSTGQSVYWSGL